MVEAPEGDDVSNAPYFQVSFYSLEKILLNFPETIFNVPSSSGSDQLNLLVNKAAEEIIEDWEKAAFDFLIESVLLRTSLLEFAETAGLSGESVIKIQCILREPAPVPDKEFLDSDWISDVKVSADTYVIYGVFKKSTDIWGSVIFSVNYGGELCLWSLTDGKKLLTKKVNKDDALKCLDLFGREDEQFVVTGSQNQTLTMFQITNFTDRKKSNSVELTLQIVFRGHERSVECVSAKPDGTRLVSGSFDHCLKVWNTVKESEDSNFECQQSKADAKRAKITAVIKVPMVTLQSHREAIVDVQWNPLNEKQVVTASWDHTIITWDLELAGTLSTMNSNKAFNSLSINKETGLILTGSSDPIIRLWDPRSREGSFVKQSFLGHKGWVSDVCWAPNADNLFVSSSFDASIKMWDTRSPRACLYDLLGHEDRALAVDWSNEEVIASGAADSTIKTYRRGARA